MARLEALTKAVEEQARYARVRAEQDAYAEELAGVVFTPTTIDDPVWLAQWYREADARRARGEFEYVSNAKRRRMADMKAKASPKGETGIPPIFSFTSLLVLPFKLIGLAAAGMLALIILLFMAHPGREP